MTDEHRPRLRADLSRRIIDAELSRVENVSVSPLLPRAGSVNDDSGFNYFAVLRRRKITILAVMLLGLLTAVFVSKRQIPEYRARVSLEVQALNDSFLNARDVTPTAVIGEAAIEPFIQRQAELLKDQALIKRVVLKCALDRRPEYGNSVDGAVATVLQHLQVQILAPARLIVITYDAQDAQRAALVANTLANEFGVYTSEKRYAKVRQTVDWLQDQVSSLESSLARSERELEQYANSTGLLVADDKSAPVENRLRSMESELASAEADRILKESRFTMATQSSPQALPRVDANGPLQEYQVKLTDLRRQRAELLTLLTPENYKVERINAQIAELEAAAAQEMANLPERIRNEYRAATDREKLLLEAYEKQVERAARDSANSIHYATLFRKLETTRTLLSSLVQKAQEASWVADQPTNPVTIAAQATPPERSFKPNLRLNMSIGLFAGAFVGITLVGLQESRVGGFKVPGEAGRYLGIPELGVIPSATTDPTMRKPGVMPMLMRSPLPVENVTRDKTESLIAEAFRGTVSSLFFSNRGWPARVIVFTSPGPSDGKTMLVSNLGVALAQINRRTLLISADLRQPRLHHVFKVESTPGLMELLESDVIDTNASLSKFIHSTDIPNLSVLPHGFAAVTHNNIPAALLHSERLDWLLTRLKKDFDHVLIDTPPALHIPDARIIARRADGVVLVVRSKKTSKSAAAAVVQRFAADHTFVLGMVLNDWDPTRRDGDAAETYRSTYRYYQRTPPQS